MEKKEPLSQTYRLLNERGQKCGHRYGEENMGQAHGEEGTERGRLLRGTGGVISPPPTHTLSQKILIWQTARCTRCSVPVPQS